MKQLINAPVAALVLAMALGSGPASAAEPVVLINVFEVPAGQEDAAVKAWERARDFLQGQPGYIDTKLHRTLQPGGKFALVNVAHWRSPEDFQAASRAMRQALGDVMPNGVTFTPNLYRVVRE